MVTRFRTQVLLLAATGLISSTSFGQYRLNKFFSSQPTVSSLVPSDGSTLFLLQFNDSTLLQKCDPLGQPLWAKILDGPGLGLGLFENSDATTTLMETFVPEVQVTGGMALDSVTQSIRITTLDAAGNTLWSRLVSMRFLSPYDFPPTAVSALSVPTSDGGIMTAVMNRPVFYGPVVLHLFKHASNGSLLWCNLLGDEFFGLHFWGDLGVGSSPFMRMVPSNDGGAYLLDQVRSGNSRPHILRLSASGEPLQFVEFDYLGFGQASSAPFMASGTQGEVLIGDRAGSGTDGNIVYRFDPQLNLLDKDIYFDVSGSISNIVSRSDGQYLIRLGAVSNGSSVPLWLEVDGTGEIQAASLAPQIPYVDGQLLKFISLATGFFESGVRMAYSQLITHPVLGNQGYFTGQALLDPNGTSCYFEPTSAQHIEVPDSLVSIIPDVLPDSFTATYESENSTPFSAAPPIPTLLGCDAQVGVVEQLSQTMSTVAPNPLKSGEPFRLTVDGPMRLSVLDMTGKTIVDRILIPGSGTWESPFTTPRPGAYILYGTAMNDDRTSVVRLIVQ